MHKLETLTAAVALTAIAAITLPVSTAQAASERLLVQEADLIVVVDQDVPCGQPAPITVRASDANIFRHDSARMQGIVDGVRAILGYECTRVPALNITGETGAPRQVVYTATAGDQTNWLVRPSQTIDGGQPPASTTSSVQAPPVDVSDVSVAGLSTGMTAERALNAANDEFGRRPTYWSDTGVIIAGSVDCEDVMVDGESPAIGQRCLIARLTDNADPRVYQLVFRQTVDQDQRQAISDQLFQRFGEPRRESRGMAPSATAGTSPEFAYYAWRNPVDMVVENDGHPAHIGTTRHGVEAYVLATSGKTELTIWVTDSNEVGSGTPRHSAKF